MVTIILDHPWHGSFNKAILDTLAEKYKSEGKEYQVIDLHKDSFNPVYTEKELANYKSGHTDDPLILKYQDMIRKTTEIIFIFPIWWGTLPAMTKGFFDKVMLYNFAFNYENGWNPLLKINKGAVITTSQSPSEMFKQNIEHGVIGSMLASTGISNVKWYNCSAITSGPKEDKTSFLEMLKEKM